MKIEQNTWKKGTSWQPNIFNETSNEHQLVLLFGNNANIADSELITKIRSHYPKATILGCSTAGEICKTKVSDESLIATAIDFSQTTIKLAVSTLESASQSYDVATRLAKELLAPDLRHVLVISDGLNVNGSELVSGFRDGLPSNINVTGGLSGDGEKFEETLVIANDKVSSKLVAALGLYGEGLQVSFGSLGGWDKFGPNRRITKSVGNELFELDGKSALALYKTYLGEHAAELPASGLLFPLLVKDSGNESGVVRTILAIDENKGSITFAGNIPQGGTAQLMRANFDRLIDGAIGAATTTADGLSHARAEFALLISCVGRKMVLKQRIEEEVEGVSNVLGESVPLAGFYSYGEISPYSKAEKCELHNQTMTITAFLEKNA